MSFGIVHDWKYGAFPDDHFAVSVQRLRDAKPGDHVVMPIVPDGWQMELVKKTPLVAIETVERAPALFHVAFPAPSLGEAV